MPLQPQGPLSESGKSGNIPETSFTASYNYQDGSDKLTATIRFSLIYYEPGTNVGRIAEERDLPLSDLKIEGSILIARFITKQAESANHNLETFYKMTLVNSDEIKVECAGEPSPYDNLTLKRDK